MFETFVLNFSFFLSPASFSSSIIAFLRSRHVSDRGRRDAESFERVSHWIPFEMWLAVFRAVFGVRLLFSQDPFAQLPLRSLLIGGRSDMPKRSTWRRIFFCRRFIGFLKFGQVLESLKIKKCGKLLHQNYCLHFCASHFGCG